MEELVREVEAAARVDLLPRATDQFLVIRRHG
jgi:hypothetical protein